MMQPECSKKAHLHIRQKALIHTYMYIHVHVYPHKPVLVLCLYDLVCSTYGLYCAGMGRYMCVNAADRVRPAHRHRGWANCWGAGRRLGSREEEAVSTRL